MNTQCVRNSATLWSQKGKNNKKNVVEELLKVKKISSMARETSFFLFPFSYFPLLLPVEYIAAAAAIAARPSSLS